jgi:hypothetical protein
MCPIFEVIFEDLAAAVSEENKVSSIPNIGCLI